MLRVERKLTTDFDFSGGQGEKTVSEQKSELGSLQRSSFQFSTLGKSFSDLILTEDEEEGIEVVCRMLVPALEQVNLFEDAYSGVNRAAQAIFALQNVQANLEDRLSVEVANRLQIEEAFKSGIDMLASIKSKRQVLLLLSFFFPFILYYLV